MNTDEEAAALEQVFSDGIVRVAELDGEAECSVSAHRGLFNYDGADLDLCVVSSVTTSHIGRKSGFARNLTAQVLQTAATEGAELAILGMFEQGFYNLLGFGTGPYEHQLRFDPADLIVTAEYHTPVRLSGDDAGEMHSAYMSRQRSHGGLVINSLDAFRAECVWTSKPVGLGYRDSNGALTHYIWGTAKGESGPYNLALLVYQDTSQLLELLALLKSLGDQVRSVTMQEPGGNPVSGCRASPRKIQDPHERDRPRSNGNRATAWWQARILDIGAVVSKRRWSGPTVRFNLDLTDPLEALLDGAWRGVGGTYVIEVGATSTAKQGSQSDLPTLSASVNAFTRMWIGAASASTLAVTDSLVGDPRLLAQLDQALRLPPPHPGTFF